ncbi:MAG: Txe/YoeB family addiction module toxin [Caldilineaceae bacterium]
MRRIIFESGAFEDFNSWTVENKQIHNKIVRLIKEIQRSPFTGLGKPEPLRHNMQGYWSRRIDDEHRLTYKVTDQDIIIVGCKYHYE